MTSRISKEDAYEVADSTDWLGTPLKSLATIDSALRCQVCKDFYTTPMITSCAHTFCSLCIRRCLGNDGRCPACRTNDQELKLRFNGAMEELVQAFIKARPEILEHARKPEYARGSRSPKRRREDVDMEEEEAPRKRTRSSARTKPQQKVVVLDTDDDEDYVPEDGYVLCPVCSAEVKETSINAHLDRNCEDEPSKKPRKSSAPPPSFPSQKPIKSLERLAQVNYSMLKDGPLKKKLLDQGLSAAGNRPLLMKRYTEWVTLWNANCDATKPKTKGELKREMDVWERTQGGKAPSTGFAHNTGLQIRDKEFDGIAWSTKHDDDFRTLIANARRKPAATASKSTPENVEKETDKVSTELDKAAATVMQPQASDDEMTSEEVHERNETRSELSLPSSNHDKLRDQPRERSRFFDEDMRHETIPQRPEDMIPLQSSGIASE